MSFAPSKRKDKALSSLIDQEELNLTPFMDVLVVLIPALLSMAVFTQISVISFSLPPAMEVEEAGTEDKKDEQVLDISIAVTETGFTLVGTGQVMPPILKTSDGKYDLAALDKVLRAIKMQYPRQEDLVLLMEPGILYQDIVDVMDLCRDAQFPNIGISGGIR